MVGVQLPFHFGNIVLDHILLVVGKPQGFHHRSVAFHKLCGGKARRNVNPLGVVFYHMGNGMDRPVDGAAAEILPFWHTFDTCSFDCKINQFFHSLILTGGNWDNRNADRFLKCFNFYGSPVGSDFIHHIQRNHHWNVQFNELHT